MKLKTGVLVIFLVFGLLGVPNCIFAQDYDYSSNAVLESSIPTTIQANGLTVNVKGSSGGKSFSSASKTVKKLSDGDDEDFSDDNGGSWWITIIIIIIILLIIAAWYLFLRK